MIREVGRGDLPLGQVAEEIDRSATAPWRCFVAVANERFIHHAFVQMRPQAPFLFRVFTAPERRAEGVFSQVVEHIAAVLAAEGATALYSSSGRRNQASLRAHRRAGFVVVRRRYDPVVLGVPLRPLARRLITSARALGRLPR